MHDIRGRAHPSSQITVMSEKEGLIKQGAPATYQGAAVVFQPQGGVTPQGPPANDYFVMSILTVFCCFMPLGLVTLIKSIETRGHNDRGEYQAARIASRQARLFNRLSILVGFLIWLSVFIFSQIGWIVPLAIVLALPKNTTTLHTT